MKTTKLILVLFFVVFAICCHRENEIPNVTPIKENGVYSRILALGFNKNQIVEFKDYYLVEGDIMFKKIAEVPSSPNLKQAETGYGGVTQITNIKVYLDTASYSSLNLNYAFNWALWYYNQVHMKLSFTRTRNINEANIIVGNGTADVCGVSEWPAQGWPGLHVYLDEDHILNEYPNFSIGQQEFLLIHEIGHALALRHTNWYELGETNPPAVTISGTPESNSETPDPDPNSVMEGNSCGNSWSYFTHYDLVALNTYYPNPTSYLSVGPYSYEFDATPYGPCNAWLTANCTWDISTDAEWLTINPIEGFTDSDFTIEAAENTGCERYATVTIYHSQVSEYMYITQSAGGECR